MGSRVRHAFARSGGPTESACRRWPRVVPAGPLELALLAHGDPSARPPRAMNADLSPNAASVTSRWLFGLCESRWSQLVRGGNRGPEARQPPHWVGACGPTRG